MSNKATELSIQYLKNLSADFSVSPPIPREGIMGKADNGAYYDVQVNSQGELIIDPTNLDDRYVNITGDTMTGYLTINGTLNTTSDHIKSVETLTRTAIMSDSAEEYECNSTTPYTLTMPTGVHGKVISIVNIGTGLVTLSGSINEDTALRTIALGESCIYKYSSTNSKWN